MGPWNDERKGSYDVLEEDSEELLLLDVDENDKVSIGKERRFGVDDCDLLVEGNVWLFDDVALVLPLKRSSAEDEDCGEFLDVIVAGWFASASSACSIDSFVKDDDVGWLLASSGIVLCSSRYMKLKKSVFIVYSR